MATSSAEHELFTAVIDAISNDRFLRFMEQFTHSLIAPTSPRFLQWCSEARSVALEEINHASTSLSSESSIQSFTVQHYRAFETYQLMFESRINSILRNIDAALTSERFFLLCEQIVGGYRVAERREHAQHAHAGECVSVEELCHTLLDMVEFVTSFQCFSSMLATRQLALLQGDDSGTDDG